MGKFYELVKQYDGNDKDVMWKSVAVVDELMTDIEEKHTEKFWELMRKFNEIYEGEHYTEEFAKMDVFQMQSEQNGVEYEGEFWSMAQVREVVKERRYIPDYYVALNYWKHRFGEKYKERFGENADNYIVEDATDFFFDDNAEKSIWCYMKEK